MLKQLKPQYPIPPQLTPWVPNETAPGVPAPRVQFPNQLPVPPQRVHPKETVLEVEPISRHTRSYTQTE